MKIGMIQSNYIPWRGYFDFIDDVDLFVFYDDVQYTPRDWRNRNRIKTANGVVWLSVPVLHTRETLIQEARIEYANRWVEKHVRSVALAYGRAPYYGMYAPGFFEILDRRPATISELNVELCRWAMRQLGIGTKTMMSSELGLGGSGSKYDRPLEILKALGATTYLCGPTARPYTEPERFERAGIELQFKTYDYGPYPQLWGGFAGDVSVLDLLFNAGPAARTHLKSRTPALAAVPA